MAFLCVSITSNAQLLPKDPEMFPDKGFYLGNQKYLIVENQVSEIRVYNYAFTGKNVDEVCDSVLLFHVEYNEDGLPTWFEYCEDWAFCTKRKKKLQAKLESLVRTTSVLEYNENGNVATYEEWIEIGQNEAEGFNYVFFTYDSEQRISEQLSIYSDYRPTETDPNYQHRDSLLYTYYYDQDVVKYVTRKRFEYERPEIHLRVDTFHYNIHIDSLFLMSQYFEEASKFDEFGRIIEYEEWRTTHGLDGPYRYRNPNDPIIKLEYDSFGNVSKETKVSPDGEILKIWEGSYNSKGLVDSWGEEYRHFYIFR